MTSTVAHDIEIYRSRKIEIIVCQDIVLRACLTVILSSKFQMLPIPKAEGIEHLGDPHRLVAERDRPDSISLAKVKPQLLHSSSIVHRPCPNGRGSIQEPREGTHWFVWVDRMHNHDTIIII